MSLGTAKNSLVAVRKYCSQQQEITSTPTAQVQTSLLKLQKVFAADARMHPILNMLQVFADGVKFLDTVDTSGDKKVCIQCKPTLNSQDLCSATQDKCLLQNAAFIAEQIGAAVVAAGEHNVDLVVTDLGGGNKQAGAILMER